MPKNYRWSLARARLPLVLAIQLLGFTDAQIITTSTGASLSDAALIGYTSASVYSDYITWYCQPGSTWSTLGPTGSEYQTVCVTGTIFEGVEETRSLMNYDCWPLWTGGDWDATRVTGGVSTPTGIPSATSGPTTSSQTSTFQGSTTSTSQLETSSGGSDDSDSPDSSDSGSSLSTGGISSAARVVRDSQEDLLNSDCKRSQRRDKWLEGDPALLGTPLRLLSQLLRSSLDLLHVGPQADNDR
ncbi:hypothetical protein BDY21DRAFT_367627 [Lineolata rhizophorae]|uniref:Uncharacterized protein n=1 Tax=Lineolata rhizophorae TaxID=578093 RepID=A0A6A6NLJ3_9PEZI|nr:hypothetical protein BDY21DRAFT_367627 [Lineolata rhizophorae]